MSEYWIFTDATADMNEKSMAYLPFIQVIPMQVFVGGWEYTYGPYGTITKREFYNLQDKGNFAKTSQINPTVYMRYFRMALQEGIDILYLCFSSGMSGTIQSAQLAIQELQDEYPERNIICIDTLCASVGQGLLIYEAAKRQAEGMCLNDLAQWILENRLNVCHWFTVDKFEHLLKGGRVSPAAAVVGTVLQIKPLLYVNQEGKLAVAEKLRGRKKALHAQIRRMEAEWEPEISRYVLIGHSHDPEGALELKYEVLKKFPDAVVAVTEVGPVIGAHTGPGLLALVYWGKNR